MSRNPDVQIPAGMVLVSLLFSIVGISLIIMALALLIDLGEAVLGVTDIGNLAEFFALVGLIMLLVGIILLFLGVSAYRGKAYGWWGMMIISLLFMADGALALTGSTDTTTAVLATLLAFYLVLPGVRAFFGIVLVKKTRTI